METCARTYQTRRRCVLYRIQNHTSRCFYFTTSVQYISVLPNQPLLRAVLEQTTLPFVLVAMTNLYVNVVGKYVGISENITFVSAI